jgi:hypothetical protein
MTTTNKSAYLVACSSDLFSNEGIAVHVASRVQRPKQVILNKVFEICVNLFMFP